MTNKFRLSAFASLLMCFVPTNDMAAQNANAMGNNEIILHAWSWSFNTISEHLQEIKDAGYTIV